MKIIVDMNLTPRWCELLRRAGFATDHWLETGAPNAPDDAVMAWATANNAVVFTCDLDFSAILAKGRSSAPSVVQARGLDVSPEALGESVVQALTQFREELERGCILTIDSGGVRARILPLR
ncbi:MAG: DUF5615 family PIN-like protein [Phycisphaerales bacterium]